MLEITSHTHSTATHSRRGGGGGASCSLHQVIDGSSRLHKGLRDLVHHCIGHPAVNLTQLLTELLCSLVEGSSAVQ